MAEEVASEGKMVSVFYTGRLEDGNVFDTNRDAEPFQFQVGGGQVIQGFEDAVKDLEPGNSKTVTIPPEEAYGPRDEELVIPVSPEIFGDQQPEPGMEVALRGKDGSVFNGRVTDNAGDAVQVDLNHPLAGKTLIFDIELVQVD